MDPSKFKKHVYLFMHMIYFQRLTLATEKVMRQPTVLLTIFSDALSSSFLASATFVTVEANVGELQVYVQWGEKGEGRRGNGGYESMERERKDVRARGLRASRGRARAPCDSYNIVIAMTVITSRKVFLHNQHYSQFRREWAAGNARPEKIETDSGVG